MIYPNAKRQDVVDDFHGTAVADPYRWLEDDDSQDTAAWTAAQDDLARQYLDGLDGRDELRRRLRELVVGFVGLPVPRGDCVFYGRGDPQQELAVLCVREPGESERVLVDPNTLSGDHTITLDVRTYFATSSAVRMIRMR